MYRRTDPDTSRRAAHELIASGKLGERQCQVLALVHQNPGHTHGELAAIMYRVFPELGILSCAESPHKRLSELEEKGFVAAVGERVCRETKKSARLWYPKKLKERGQEQKDLFA